MINDINTQKRKQNMKIYSMYRAISMDLIFFYAIDFLFLTQVKNISASDVVLKTSFYALFMVILQIPANILIDKMGTRRCTILANIFNTIYLLMIIFAIDLKTLIIAEFFSALCFSIKDISDTTLLNMSIPETDKKGEIFSKIEGRGNKNYYYINAITSVLSGFLYTVNPYIPVIGATIIAAIATVLSAGFQEIENPNQIAEKKNISIDKYIIDLKNSFKFIIESNRLRSLLIYSGIMWGTFCLANTYRTSLLEEIEIPATWIAIIAAIIDIASGIGSKKQLKIHKMFKNKSLSVLAFTTAIMIWLSGIIGNSNLLPNSIMILVTIFYIILNANKGIFGVLMTRYLSNFTNSNILPKIYSVNSISRNFFRMIIGFLGSYILSITNTANSLILTGIIFTIVVLSLISYMKTRTGLKPEEYQKDDIEFDI
jgi:membrane protein